MKIEKAKICNYKSFKETQDISFGAGFNVIVGQNNVGKTALVEALSLGFMGNPHKSIAMRPGITNPISSIDCSISLSKEELNDLLLRSLNEIYVPVGGIYGSGSDSQQKLNQVLSSEAFLFECQISASSNSGSSLSVVYSSIRELCKVPRATQEYYPSALFRANPEKTAFMYHGAANVTAASFFDNQIANILRSNIYIFKAERLNIGICESGVNGTLAPNASNLPEVLHNLQTKNTQRFLRLVRYIRQIFPSIMDVSVRPVQGNRLEIITWTCDPQSERQDLTIPLSDSGTGVGQALAILYVTITSEYPKVIIIDEPNSFLHPSATRKLIEILRAFPQHQFIVTTHSPEVVRAANAEKINLIRWIPPQSQIEQLEGIRLHEISRCLQEVGAKLSDVFGADLILWVEGPTEESAFNLLIQKGLLTAENSINIVAVKNTGDFQRKNKHIDLILDIYQKLSNGNALIPPAIGFVFDKEKLSNTEIQDINRRSKGLVSFLPRRMYENYLLDSEAIAAVMNSLPTFAKNNLEPKIIDSWILGHAEKYIEPPFQIDSLDWLNNVDAAKLLADLFAEISSNQETYDKTRHSLEITEWLINNKKEKLDELLVFLSKIVQK